MRILPRPLRSLRHLSRAGELGRSVRRSPDWAALIAGYLGLRALRYPRVFRTRAGDSLVLADFHDLVTAWIIFFRDEYEIDPSCRTIVDAGANIGAFSLRAAREAPAARIIALEPFPATWSRLREHIGRNHLEGRVACRPWALGGSDAVRRMDDAGDGPSQSRGLLGGDHAGGGVPVEAVTLATLLRREQLDRVDLLKMDIEGSEHEVLAATPPEVLRRVGSIALEYHPVAPKAALFARLLDAGFALVRDVPIAPDTGVAHFDRRPGHETRDTRHETRDMKYDT
jgi:FkbM family methyltransferase